MKTIGGRSGIGRRGNVHIVDARAVDLDKAADRRVAALDQPDADPGDADEDKDERAGKQGG